MSKRFIQVAGLAVAGGAGYYLYTAGGSPKAAEKQFEADVHRASAKVKGELPGSITSAQKQGEAYAEKAGAKFDSAVADARAKGRELDSKISAGLKDADAKYESAKADAKAKYSELSKEASKNIDQFDKTVEKKVSEAKTGISSWFGGK